MTLAHHLAGDLGRAFGRNCAMSVLHLWDAPRIVRAYLKTGDESIRAAACAAAWDVSSRVAPMHPSERAAARAAGWAAGRDLDFLAVISAATFAKTANAPAAAWTGARDAYLADFDSMIERAMQ